ncbi:redoxin family protein [Rhodococcoides kroppenstedtii]|uniref:redoxin family protein n=1 Tax=Rhodococcoides kroppenstedtii TaxID=293050 RepID=UPI001427B639|nr:Thiol-disulfide oxidoreductase ResA [Rhodococcus kroppenstedtii]
MRPSSAARWSLAALAVVIALIVAIWPRDDDVSTPGSFAEYRDRAGTTATGDAPTVDLGAERAAAGLAECPRPADGGAAEPTGPLAGLQVTCLADGAPIDLGRAVAGRPVVLNLWAHWCEPCAEELPYLQQYAARAGDAVTVLTVHEDPQQGSALARLTDYGVRLPGVQDGGKSVAAAVGAPAVLPVSVLLDPSGDVAAVLPQPFRSVEEIAEAVRTRLGVTT